MPKLELTDGGVTVRMYRPGHGDCFLLALPREGGGDPVYVLVDCGYKPGSSLSDGGVAEVVEHIGESTGWHLDLMIVTHEHQDHVNGIWKAKEPYFGPFTIDEAWMAWTEDPADALANELRRRHRDTLLGLLAARSRLAAASGEEDPSVRRVDALLGLEWGGEDEDRALAGAMAAKDPEKSVNKQAMKLVKDKAREGRGVRYLSPAEPPRAVSGSAVRAWVLGPPRSAELLRDEDPVGDEAFPGDRHARGLSFGAAARGPAAGTRPAPFGTRHCVPLDEALAGDAFFRSRYGRVGDGEDDSDGIEAPDDAAWRRIGDEWLFSAESLALALNKGINNTSLVLALELPASRKVLLFVGDAQRGNWISWADCRWTEGGETVTARDLLGRTVLYKVGHHGSHNATLDGAAADDHPNLAWMAQGAFAGEFTAMITAVNEWAVNSNDPPWYHPLPSIRAALLKKAQGRVFQTDVARPERPKDVPEETWKAFTGRADFQDLYFDYVIPDT